MDMNASELTHYHKVKIEGRWYKVNRIWVVGNVVEVSVSAGSIRFGKNQKVEAK